MLILRIMLTYIGVFVGTVSAHLVQYVFYRGNPYVWLGFYLMIVAIPIQISLLISVAWGFAKLANVRLFSSLYDCFGIGFFFSLIYIISLGVISEVKFLSKVDNIWFNFTILPVLVYLPLVYIDYLLSK